LFPNPNHCFLDQLSGSPYYPGVGPIQAQGLAYDSNLNHVYTCCQTATGDALAVYNTATAPMTLIGTVPLTLSLASSGCSIALDTANNHILITCAGGLWVVNATSLEPIQSTPFSTDGSDPRGLVVANGKVFVCNFGSDTLAVLNSSTLAASSSPLTTGHSPRNVAYNSTTGLIYVTNFNGNPGGLSVFNASTLAPQTPTGLMNLSNLSFTNLVVGP
jgi:YVTN family beta-propeller protein